MKKVRQNQLTKSVQNKIYLLRGQEIVLDRDLAEFYGVKPYRLREQIKRNLRRFPDDFMFQLAKNEIEVMVSQNAIPSKKHLGGSLPYAFTEHGALMVASVLNTTQAVEMSVFIIRAFVEMRKMLSSHQEILTLLKEMERHFNYKINVHQILIQGIVNTLDELTDRLS